MGCDTQSLHPRYQLDDAERAMLQGTWPLELIEDPERQPRIVESAVEFLREVLVGDQLEECVVLPNGVDLLDLSWEDTIPEDIRSALHDCRNVADFTRRLKGRPETVERYRADIEYVDVKRRQRDVLRRDKYNLGRRIDHALQMAETGAVDPALLYVAEMRMKKAARHPIGGEKVKTLCLRDVKDVLGPYAGWTLYWDRYDEGFFAGGRGSGKGLHIDQVLWCNVGRNWHGYKLFASWPKGEISKRVSMDFYDVLFSPPLGERELACLRQASKITLLRPGDVYLCCGGVAHATLVVSEEMCLSAYESFVSLRPAHVELFMHTGDREGCYSVGKYIMPSRELKDTKDDCIEQLEDAAGQILGPGSPAAAAAAARPSAAAPTSWAGLLASLHADSSLQATLREFYAEAVERCRSDRYFERHLPQKVLDAALACGLRISGAKQLREKEASGRAAKRQRCNSPASQGSDRGSRSSASSSSSSCTGGDSA